MLMRAMFMNELEVIHWPFEMLELYGKPTHEDWLRFLDEEILAPLPDDEREFLATLAVAEKPIPWKTLADGLQWDGKPPSRLMDYGLLIELDQGMWFMRPCVNV